MRKFSYGFWNMLSKRGIYGINTPINTVKKLYRGRCGHWNYLGKILIITRKHFNKPDASYEFIGLFIIIVKKTYEFLCIFNLMIENPIVFEVATYFLPTVAFLRVKRRRREGLRSLLASPGPLASRELLPFVLTWRRP